MFETVDARCGRRAETAIPFLSQTRPRVLLLQNDQQKDAQRYLAGGMDVNNELTLQTLIVRQGSLLLFAAQAGVSIRGRRSRAGLACNNPGATFHIRRSPREARNEH